MTDQLLDCILADIRQRLDALRPACEETQRLEAALVALDKGRPRRGTLIPLRRPRRQTSRPTGARAPRGENLRLIREAIAQRSDPTTGEVASATGIARPTVAATLSKLVRARELERTQLPDGGVGFRQAQKQSDPASSKRGSGPIRS